MMVFVKKKYFEAIKSGEKNCEIRHKPADAGAKILFICGRDKVEKVVKVCEEWNLSHFNEFRVCEWWDEFCDQYISRMPCFVWRFI